MAKNQNITLSIPKELLHKARLIAAKNNTTLSELLTQSLVVLVERHEGYEQAHRRNLALLVNGLDLGTQGNLALKRSEIHERND